MLYNIYEMHLYNISADVIHKNYNKINSFNSDLFTFFYSKRFITIIIIN